jgi:hypothetical protein
MHKSETHQHGSRQVTSQAQADSCCAVGAQRHESTPSPSTVASSGAITLAPSAPFAILTSAAVVHEWRALVPLRVSTVPKHLLLSVLLV